MALQAGFLADGAVSLLGHAEGQDLRVSRIFRIERRRRSDTHLVAKLAESQRERLPDRATTAAGIPEDFHDHSEGQRCLAPYRDASMLVFRGVNQTLTFS